MKKISKNKEKINKIVSEILKISIDKMYDNIEMNKISQWDSVAHLLIISSLEEEFKIQFSSSEVSKLVDLKSIYQIIEVNLIK
tara:strand:- start:51 stop:299 length:249 start_codon:yes stop_codon:yes gene_type:complete